MLTATIPYTSMYTDGRLKFAAHVANYPVCWVYNREPGCDFKDFTGSPLLIQAGELDTYDEPDTCRNLVRSLSASARSFIAVCIYRNTSHAWDRLQSPMTVTDPFSHLGMGGSDEFVPNPEKALESRSNTVRFFQQAFGMGR